MAASIADQGFASIPNYALNIFLGRALPPANYGAFAVAFSVYVLAIEVQRALVLEPMSVIGPIRYREELPEYLSVIIRVQARASVWFGAAVLCAAVVAPRSGTTLPLAICGFGVSLPFILYFCLVRRACYLKTQPALASLGSACYGILFFAGLAGLWASGHLSATAGFLLMGGASAASAVVIRDRLGLRRGSPGASARAIVEQHWAYGRWILGAVAGNWLSLSIYPVLLGAAASLDLAGGFRAIETLLLPLGQLCSALTTLILPWAAREAAAGTARRVQMLALKISVAMVCLTSSYVILLVLNGQRIVDVVWGKGFYVSLVWLLPYFGVGIVLRSISDIGIGVASRVMGHPNVNFWSVSGGAIITLAVGVPLTLVWGALGAGWGRVLGPVAELAVIATWFVGTLLRERTGSR